MSFRHLVKAANAASFGWQLSGSGGYLAAQVPALIVAPVPALYVRSEIASPFGDVLRLIIRTIASSPADMKGDDDHTYIWLICGTFRSRSISATALCKHPTRIYGGSYLE